VLSHILSVSSPSRGITIDDLRREGGAMRVRALGPEGGTSGIYSEYLPDEPIVPLRDFVEKKRPYPTLTGRQSSNIDHPWSRTGEELPEHKSPPAESTPSRSPAATRAGASTRCGAISR
jgi:complex iron-sulfur molybdoenzyme family reductase subunit alpha